MLNTTFHSFQRGSHKHKRSFCTKIRNVLISSLLAPTLDSSTNILLLAFHNFHLEKTMTHFSPFSNVIHPKNAPTHPSQTTLLFPLPSSLSFNPSLRSTADPTSHSPPGCFAKQTHPTPPPFALLFLFLLTPLSLSLSPHRFLPALPSTLYLRSLTHPANNKEPPALAPR